eukprot:scaffold38608_cov14-Tisochrysis_lutea.AAC.1
MFSPAEPGAVKGQSHPAQSDAIQFGSFPTQDAAMNNNSGSKEQGKGSTNKAVHEVVVRKNSERRSCTRKS